MKFKNKVSATVTTLSKNRRFPQSVSFKWRGNWRQASTELLPSEHSPPIATPKGWTALIKTTADEEKVRCFTIARTTIHGLQLWITEKMVHNERVEYEAADQLVYPCTRLHFTGKARGGTIITKFGEFTPFPIIIDHVLLVSIQVVRTLFMTLTCIPGIHWSSIYMHTLNKLHAKRTRLILNRPDWGTLATDYRPRPNIHREIMGRGVGAKETMRNDDKDDNKRKERKTDKRARVKKVIFPSLVRCRRQ